MTPTTGTRVLFPSRFLPGRKAGLASAALRPDFNFEFSSLAGTQNYFFVIVNSVNSTVMDT